MYCNIFLEPRDISCRRWDTSQAKGNIKWCGNCSRPFVDILIAAVPQVLVMFWHDFRQGGVAPSSPVIGRILHTVQGYFWRAWQRSDAICVMRPDHWVRSEVLSPTPHWDMRWQSYHIITTSLLGCRTAFLHRRLVLGRPNMSELMVISMDLFS